MENEKEIREDMIRYLGNDIEKCEHELKVLKSIVNDYKEANIISNLDEKLSCLNKCIEGVRFDKSVMIESFEELLGKGH